MSTPPSSDLPSSPLSSTVTICSATQRPSSPFATSIPHEEIVRLTTKYNRQLMPMMDDEKFRAKIHELTQRPTDRLESDLSNWMRVEGDRLLRDSMAAKISMSIDGLDCFVTDEPKHHFIAGLKYHDTVHGLQSLLAYVLPSLVRRAQRRRQLPGERRPNHDTAWPSTIQHTSLRRSARIQKKR